MIRIKTAAECRKEAQYGKTQKKYIVDVTACEGNRQSGRVYWPLFGCLVTIVMGQDEPVSFGYAEQCVSQLSLIPKPRSGTAPAVLNDVSFIFCFQWNL